MKLFILSILILFSISAKAEVHCSATVDDYCPPSAECIKIESILGTDQPVKPSEDDSVE
jgi:hypothetical protein